ncbi:UNVERIFIED_ORG: hypothetical protein QE446_004665 [Rhizobium sp. SORGH_AS260]|uniref:hypothetical protein n=1 Tax=Agrobacterium sp. SORGH_AS_0440 TaxID=3041757 RepID=UPI000DDAEDFF|nr:hypothetical protein [Agrobacterium sp. SORGH_AS_0440]MDP9734522.1 hypothetical protein [Rhizobium sp. SORGH_AS_0285]MDP9756741.1 hypothetical protein [Rhizobium sp. SORGH_AS_0260]MDR6084008.1 hypothetical protein [Agrobacterium sp. SORGH_AS_0440]
MAFQGNLDGLCGPYAIVNALAYCGMSGREEEMFIAACSSPSIRRWPNLLWEGTTFGDLQRMLTMCLSLPGARDTVRVFYPFLQFVPTTNADFWISFDEFFAEEDTRCVILRMTKPSHHWIVAFREPGSTRISFLDSDPFKPSLRKNRTNIFAGDRRHRATQWLIDRRDVIVFKA